MSVLPEGIYHIQTRLVCVCRQRKDGLGFFCPGIAGRLVTAGTHLRPGSSLFPSSGSSAALAGSMSLDFWMWKLCASVPVSKLYSSGMFCDVLGKFDHDLTRTWESC